MTVAECWETNAPDLPDKITAMLTAAKDVSLEGLKLLAAFPEWKVDLPGGKNSPSQTDVLALASNEKGLVVLGCEAKVDEPFGPTLGKKRNGASSGQKQRIAYFEKKLGCGKLKDSIRYQLIHRTVSVLCTAQEFHAHVAIMLVQSFSPKSKGRKDFDVFIHAMGACQITSDLYEFNGNSRTRLLSGWVS